MQALTLISNNESVTFSLDKPNGIPTHYVFNTIYGIGKPDVTVNETQGMGQDGTTIHSVAMQSRDIELNIYNYGESDQEMYRTRAALGRVLASNDGNLRLEYTNDHASWYIYGVVTNDTYEPKIRLGGTFMPRKLTIHCPDPILRRAGISRELDLLYVGGRFKFPFKIPPEGVTFGAQGYMGEINNEGSAYMPIEARIFGPAYNPELKNITTGYTMAFNTNITPYQCLYINTAQGNKTLDIINLSNGTTVGAWDFYQGGGNSKFLTIAPGINKIMYRNIGREDLQKTRIQIVSDIGDWSI